MPPRSQDDVGALEKARERLYKPSADPNVRPAPATAQERSLPHAWEEHLLAHIPAKATRHVRLARVFFTTAFAFFLISLVAAGYFFYFGGNSVSVDKISVDIQGPTTIAAGDTVPLSLAVTNRNPVPLENAVLEINFPSGTLAADGSLEPYPRYTEEVGTLASGETITRSIKAIVFGGAGETVSLPVSLSYRAGNSSTVFVKKASYGLAISSTPLSISVESLSETVSGRPLTFELTVRSNATIPIDNVVVAGTFPFGFEVTDSSEPLSGSSFILGTLEPGENKVLRLTGRLTGQNGEERVFHFTVGTTKEAGEQTPALTYMTQDTTVTITAPFLATTLALNGNTGANLVIPADTVQSATVSYTNTLPTSVTNATVEIAISGSGIDYDSIRTTSGFYRSSNRTILFSRDTDPSLEMLAPGASGIGTFSFSTLPSRSLGSSPSITFTISVSGTRVGQSNVPEEVQATVSKTVKVATAITLLTETLHSSGAIENTGPIPPRENEETTYAVVWNVTGKGSAIAGGMVSATLPSYVSYTGKTSGAGSFSYDEKSRKISWNTGDLAQGASVQGSFQVSLTPSSSQKGNAPTLTDVPTFSGYDRFAGVQVSATGNPATTETKKDPGYSSEDAVVQ